MDLTTLFVQQVIIHRVPKVKLGDKGDHKPWLSDVPSTMTDELKLYFRARISESLNSQQFTVVHDSSGVPAAGDGEVPPVPKRKPSPIPQLVIDYFDANTQNLVEVSRQMAQHLYDMQGGSSSEGLLVVIDARVGSGKDAGACLVLLKLQDDPALLVTEGKTKDGKATMSVELHNVTLPRRAKVFKVAVFPRTASLSDLSAVVSDHQRDEKSWGSEVADFFLRYLGCRLRDTADRSTKAYVEAFEAFVNTIDDEEKRTRYMLHGLSDLTSPATDINPKQFADTYFDPKDADAFKAQIALPDGSLPIIPKDTSLIENKVRNVMAEFTGGLRLVGPKQAIEDSLRQEDGHWVIDAKLQHIGPTRRR